MVKAVRGEEGEQTQGGQAADERDRGEFPALMRIEQLPDARLQVATPELQGGGPDGPLQARKSDERLGTFSPTTIAPRR